jgi:hypothetical protein
MKQIITFFCCIITVFAFAQVPQYVTYQGIATSPLSGAPIQNTPISLRLSILATGTTNVLYSEAHINTVLDF